MNPTTRTSAAVLGSFGLAAIVGAQPSGAIQLCHRPPGGPANYKTITVVPAALGQHLAHGDLPGACSSQCAALCADGDLCTTDTGIWDNTVGRCACSNPAVACTASDQCHDAGVCNASTGICSNPDKADGSACDDCDACTQTDACQSGLCASGNPVVCSALDQCHEAGACNPTTGACTDPAKPNDTTCDDDNPQTVREQCTDGTCGGGIPAHRSCREVLDAGDSTGDGVYSLVEPGGTLYEAYCDMTTDLGGWTAVFLGKNGSPNVFDHFDAGVYLGTFDNPSSVQYLQRAPAWLGDSASELAVSCGSAMVKFALTTKARNWVVSGEKSNWQSLTPAVLAGAVSRSPNWLYTGVSAASSFIFTRDQIGTFTFAASYGPQTSFDYCNGISDTTSLVRVFYREGAATPVHNTPATALQSCKAIRDASPSTDDGVYWLVEPAGTPYQAYCEMTTDGGGWTAAFAGRNGSVNVFGHFDAPGYVETCTDPATRCLRRAPASLAAASDLAVSCGGAMVKFPLTQPVRDWLSTGTQAGLQPLTPLVIAGTLPQPPNRLWTGGSGNLGRSFTFTNDVGYTFASSYDASPLYDRCNSVPDNVSLTRVLYR